MHSVSFPKSPPEKPGEVRITIAIGAAVIAQTGLGLVWAGAASERLAQLERHAGASTEIIERTARLEEQSRFMADALVRIEDKIDRAAKEAK